MRPKRRPARVETLKATQRTVLSMICICELYRHPGASHLQDLLRPRFVHLRFAPFARPCQ